MMILVTGGASCGKSAFCESLCQAFGGDLVYLAAMKPFGEEGAARVRKHRAQRAGKGFRTIECYDGLDVALSGEGIDDATVLLECLGNVVANEMFAGDAIPSPDQVLDNILKGIDNIAQRCRHLVVVGNEVGCDGISYAFETRQYQELIGAASCRIAAESDFVFECVSGIPQVVKCGNARHTNEEAALLLNEACKGALS